jgi:hypothetical protein
MATIAPIPTARKAITHYAQYVALEGTAELVNGSGFLFRREGERQATLVSYRDPALVLCGLVALADAQAAIDHPTLACLLTLG